MRVLDPDGFLLRAANTEHEYLAVDDATSDNAAVSGSADVTDGEDAACEVLRREATVECELL